MDILETKKALIKEKKKKLRELELEVKAKEKRTNNKKIIELGKLVVKANIDNLDSEILFGAFIHIQERAKDVESLTSWKNLANNIVNNLDENQISISFKSPPTTQVKEELKNLKFRWNGFRKEFYGVCNKKILEKILTNVDCKIEVVS